LIRTWKYLALILPKVSKVRALLELRSMPAHSLYLNSIFL
jgi:hypothetical protein